MVERHKTDYQIKQILKYNRDGSRDRQKARHRILMSIVAQLRDRGYSKRWDIGDLGKKEIYRLVNDWREKGNCHRTIANKVADIRWLASKVNRLDQIPPNKDLGIGLRRSAPNYQCNKAEPLLQKHLDQLDLRMKLINELKFEFGLREKEACKFQHKYATTKSDKYIRLKASWCKGGRPRVIEIVNDRQRELLKRIQVHQAEHRETSMIPKSQKYKTYRNRVQAISTSIGIKGHSFRHYWAQAKFAEVSGGIKAPLAGGPAYTSLNKKERALWNKAAKRVNEELGHGKGRRDITATYIGR
jgi:hypothetical protein